MALDHFFFFFTTKTGSIIIGCFNMAFSFFALIFYGTFIAILGFFANDLGVGDHWLIVMTYVLSGIGLGLALLQLIFASVLIHGVRERNPKCVLTYLIFGTISVVLGLVLLMVVTFSVGLLFGTLLIGGLQVYFVLVVNKEYRDILAEKTSGTAGQFPMTQKPAVMYNDA